MPEKNNAVTDLLQKAKEDLAENMQERGIGAMIWDLSTAGFPYLPELEIPSDMEDEEPQTVGVTGLYNYKGTLYLIEEGISGVDINNLYNPDTEAKPTIVTLTEDSAEKTLGNPANRKGFNPGGNLEEWLAIADCYFQALSEQFQP
ncbi:MAG: hypothetical protein K2N03_05350 [Muribaculaceae bacterium]|nr:hypothetical protein [Muribaculaceae bacterium]